MASIAETLLYGVPYNKNRWCTYREGATLYLSASLKRHCIEDTADVSVSRYWVLIIERIMRACFLNPQKKESTMNETIALVGMLTIFVIACSVLVEKLRGKNDRK